MKAHPIVLLTLLVLAAVVLAVVVLDATAPRTKAKPSDAATCDKARTSLNAGLVLQAQKTYMSALRNVPDSTCAADGLLRLLRMRCAHADVMATHAGGMAEARRTYLAILRADVPWSWTHPRGVLITSCALDGLDALRASEERLQ